MNTETRYVRLPLMKSRALKRANRSKYDPHVGAKQLSKLNQK